MGAVRGRRAPSRPLPGAVSPDFDADGLLRWAAAPILDQVAGELEGTGVGLLLSDARGQVVDRRAADTGILARLDHIELAPGFLYGEGLIGTNAIGTAIAQQAPSVPVDLTVRGDGPTAGRPGSLAASRPTARAGPPRRAASRAGWLTASNSFCLCGTTAYRRMTRSLIT
jgi:hypothetical protein